ncbi:MAG: hypothetical protein DCF16_12230 [Alphaproteobacteria bacterium]|nr:MAG: hypothetical protein DCF16_12230 [Alphaproteobacteria bacterium]
MRFAGLIVIAALAACSTAGVTGGGDGLAPLPFPVERGSALPPPDEAARGQTAPLQGARPGGIDFGQWRAADPATYAPSFQAQIRTRYAGQSNDAIRADLERNGFACEEGGRLECRIEIMENQCAVDWYVVLERNGAEPVAGFDRMCLGAR